MEKSSESDKPVVTFARCGVSVSVFENEVKDRDIPRYSTAIQKTYLKGGEVKTTTSFSTRDLPVLQTLVCQAFEHILEFENDKKKTAHKSCLTETPSKP